MLEREESAEKEETPSKTKKGSGESRETPARKMHISVFEICSSGSKHGRTVCQEIYPIPSTRLSTGSVREADVDFEARTVLPDCAKRDCSVPHLVATDEIQASSSLQNPDNVENSGNDDQTDEEEVIEVCRVVRTRRKRRRIDVQKEVSYHEVLKVDLAIVKEEPVEKEYSDDEPCEGTKPNEEEEKEVSKVEKNEVEEEVELKENRVKKEKQERKKSASDVKKLSCHEKEVQPRKSSEERKLELELDEGVPKARKVMMKRKELTEVVQNEK